MVSGGDVGKVSSCGMRNVCLGYSSCIISAIRPRYIGMGSMKWWRLAQESVGIQCVMQTTDVIGRKCPIRAGVDLEVEAM